MDDDILITKEELEYLRAKLLSHYDKSDKGQNGNMELNTHKKNYIFLAKKLTDLLQDQRKYGNAYTYKSIGTSQLLAFIHDTNQGDPKSFLVEACYQYIHGEKRKHFFQNREGRLLIESWKSPENQDDVVAHSFKKEDIEEDKFVFVTEEFIEKKAEIKPFWLRHIQKKIGRAHV